MADGPLIGFRVLDLTAVISGPFCTQLLGDLGADVIKIEPPEGDSMRRNVGPQRGGLTAAFLNFNRNKRSIVIDIKKEHGRDLVRRLAVRADALVENNRPGVADRLGIGYTDIRHANPKIVYCSICGFPPKGRLANFPAYDPVIQGYSGMAYVQGLKAGVPVAVKMALADKVSGMTAALSVVSALHAARARGVGQYIKVPMLEAMMAFTANDSIYGYTLLPEDEFKHLAPKSTTLDPFKTKDGWLTIAPFTDAQSKRLAEAVGHPEWWPETADRDERAERGRNLMRSLAKLFQEKTTAEWLPALEAADIPCGPVHNYETLLKDPEVVENESFSIYDHPEAGKVRAVNPGARFSETPMKMWRVPPKLGEHTDEVLREAGIEKSQIEELRDAKVIV
ncbi:MAG TPA: CoA transferase [Patescibacteria group bacterium]|nr:CoA transferase [Patescibacteria group bacterium]